jgi:hypothetical protein
MDGHSILHLLNANSNAKANMPVFSKLLLAHGPLVPMNNTAKRINYELGSVIPNHLVTTYTTYA